MAMGGIKKLKSGATPRRESPPPIPTPARVPEPQAREVLDGPLLDAKIERRSQAAIMQQLIERHQGEIPVWILTEQRSIRLMNNTCSGAELLARG
jgi:hypothetical protein